MWQIAGWLALALLVGAIVGCAAAYMFWGYCVRKVASDGDIPGDFRDVLQRAYQVEVLCKCDGAVARWARQMSGSHRTSFARLLMLAMHAGANMPPEICDPVEQSPRWSCGCKQRLS